MIRKKKSKWVQITREYLSSLDVTSSICNGWYENKAINTRNLVYIIGAFFSASSYFLI